MAVIGLGLDLVEISRIEQSLQRFGLRLLEKILTANERQNSDKKPARIAARFAAKEALVKALGTGFSHGINLQDIEVQSLKSGQPKIMLTGQAQKYAEQLGITKIHLSLTHTKNYASAVVVLES